MPMGGGMGAASPGMGAPSAAARKGSGDANGSAAFDFMGGAKGNDAFDFVGDVMKGNKRSL